MGLSDRVVRTVNLNVSFSSVFVLSGRLYGPAIGLCHILLLHERMGL